MAVAVNNESEVKVSSRAWDLPAVSFFGTCYLVLAVAVAYYFVPWAWSQNIAPRVMSAPDGLLSGLVQMALMVGTIAALVVAWTRALHPPARPGSRAGILLGSLAVLCGLLAAYAAANISLHYGLTEQLAGVVCAVVAAIWLWLTWRSFNNQKFRAQLESLEGQGWFTAKPYKREQGRLVRRATMLAILTVVGAGAWVFSLRGPLLSGSDWIETFPFGLGELVIIRSPMMTIPLIMLGLAVWASYRLVNVPQFADFLIATEAELNKVSWSSRQRLIQDTIVVFVTMLLMAVFLFVADLVWQFLLGDVLGVVKRG